MNNRGFDRTPSLVLLVLLPNAPLPERIYIQQGDLILMKVNEIPAGAVPADVERLPDGAIRLPGGHIVRPRTEE